MAAESLDAPVVVAAAVHDSAEGRLGLVELETQIALATEVHHSNCRKNQAKTH
jgi:hypothetical protein